MAILVAADPVAAALATVVRDFGRPIATQPQRLRGLLNDLLADAAFSRRVQVEAVVRAAEEGVLNALDPARPATDSDVAAFLARLADRGLNGEPVEFALHAWAAALGVRPTPMSPRPTEVPAPPPAGDLPTTELPTTELPPRPSEAPGDAQRPVEPRRRVVPVPHRPVLIGLAAVTALVLVVVLGTIAVNLGAGKKVPGDPGPGEAPGQSFSRQLLPETTAWGATVARIWTLDPGLLGAHIVVANPRTTAIAGLLVEVIPKSVATSTATVTSSPAPTRVLVADPVVGFDLRLGPKESKAIDYTVRLADRAASPEVLDRLVADRNAATTAYLKTIDKVPPRLLVTAPRNGERTTAATVWFMGTTEPGAAVTINGKPVAVAADGTWRTQQPLAVGAVTFTLVAADRAGNKTTVALVVARVEAPRDEPTTDPSDPATVDKVPPRLVISSPPNGARTTAATVWLTGSTEPGAAVTVNGRPVTVAGNGTWRSLQALAVGTARFSVVAADRAGNKATAVVSVVRVAPPPPPNKPPYHNTKYANPSQKTLTGDNGYWDIWLYDDAFIDPEGGDWYFSSGSAMSASISFVRPGGYCEDPYGHGCIRYTPTEAGYTNYFDTITYRVKDAKGATSTYAQIRVYIQRYP